MSEWEDNPSLELQEQLKTLFKEAGVEVLRDMKGPVDMIGGVAMATQRKLPKSDMNLDYIRKVVTEQSMKKVAFWKTYDLGDEIIIRAHYE